MTTRSGSAIASFSHRTLHVTLDPPFASAVPPEQKSPLLFGLFVHLGPSAAVISIVSITNFSLTAFLITYFAASLVGVLVTLWAERRFPSVELAPPTLHDAAKGLALVFVTGVLLGTCVVFCTRWFAMSLMPVPWHTRGWVPVAVAVPLTDFFYYLYHRFLSHSRGNAQPIRRLYRKIHVVHHGVAALDFLRGNISSVWDTAFMGFQLWLGLISACLGMDAMQTLVAYGLVLLLQGTHHMNHTVNIGWLRYIFVDNHNHKLHHCRRGNILNFGAIFSLWDRMLGTCYENTNLSASYMEKHHIHLPVRRAEVQ